MNVVKMYSGRNASACLARRRLGCFNDGSWVRRNGGGIRRAGRRRWVLQGQVSAAERGVLRSRRDDNRLHGVASALQLRQRQADAERRRVLLRIHFRRRQQGGRVHLQPVPKKNQSRAKRVS